MQERALGEEHHAVLPHADLVDKGEEPRAEERAVEVLVDRALALLLQEGRGRTLQREGGQRGTHGAVKEAGSPHGTELSPRYHLYTLLYM